MDLYNYMHKKPFFLIPVAADLRTKLMLFLWGIVKILYITLLCVYFYETWSMTLCSI